jgi:hypothetical protein
VSRWSLGVKGMRLPTSTRLESIRSRLLSDGALVPRDPRRQNERIGNESRRRRKACASVAGRDTSACDWNEGMR